MSEEVVASDRRTVTVATPEWKRLGGVYAAGVIVLAEMTGEARERYEALVAAASKPGASPVVLRAELVAACAVVDERTLAPLFNTRERVADLGQRSARVLDRVFRAAIALNVLSDEAADKIAGE